ncbi:MAG TPA: CapA family protein [Candidatus Microsaccharimonas sp.]|nr:CapA family protein [Candidatus Microsaccharimonas sp.]
MKQKYLLVLATIGIVLAGVTAEYLFVLRPGHHTPTLPLVMPARATLSPTPTSVDGRYLLNGTVVWARAVEKYANGNYAQPFSQLDTFHPEQYDAWSTDFECPITNNVVPYQTQIDKLIFNCRPEFLPAASKYFSIYDLANNHTDNQGGETGLEETRTHLEQAGDQYFGTFDPADSKNVCEVLALPVRVVKSDKSEQKSSLPIAFCGWHYFYRRPLPGEIAVMDQYAKYMPVFAFAEMGVEYHPTADATQVDIAHQIVDHGPEFLIANNPHWVQNTEVYKNKLIVYSTGNFIFDQLDTETNRSDSIAAAMTVPYDANVAKWLKLAPSCKAFHDSCLQQAQQQGLKKVKLSINFGVVAGQNGVRVITHRADETTKQAVLQRTNWTTTCAQLAKPYGCSDETKL